MGVCLATLIYGTGSVINADTESTSQPVGATEAVLHYDDRRFRRQFNIALFRLRGRGEVTADDYRKFRNASFNTLAIKDEKAFIRLLREDCEQKAGDLMDDLVKWWEWLTEWLINNWATVLKTILTLLVFLET